MTPQQEKALEICQGFGLTTMFSEDNDGYTLSLETAKKCAIIHVEAIIKELSTEIAIEASSNRLNFYRQVKTEIENM